VEMNIRASMTTGITVAGKAGESVRFTKVGIMEKQPSSSAEEVWHFYPWHLIESAVEIRTMDMGEEMDHMLFK
jgi:hypothetical protein